MVMRSDEQNHAKMARELLHVITPGKDRKSNSSLFLVGFYFSIFLGGCYIAAIQPRQKKRIWAGFDRMESLAQGTENVIHIAALLHQIG